MTKKSLTDGRTDGQTDDSTKSIVHIFQKCALKSFEHLLGTTFVLRIFKILSVDGRTLASKIKKMAKNSNFNVFFLRFERSLCPKS
jgi:type III secretory pathway component EscU